MILLSQILLIIELCLLIVYLIININRIIKRDKALQIIDNEIDKVWCNYLDSEDVYESNEFLYAERVLWDLRDKFYNI